jgi:hypothetical protein
LYRECRGEIFSGLLWRTGHVADDNRPHAEADDAGADGNKRTDCAIDAVSRFTQQTCQRQLPEKQRAFAQDAGCG